MRILLADDHEAVRIGMRRMLESQDGLTICGEAGTGRDAIEKTQELHPDLVILDISMPVLNGFVVAKVIKELFPGTAILLYSAYHSEAFQVEAEKMGLDGYVSKSSSRQALLKAIDDVQRSRSSPRPN